MVLLLVYHWKWERKRTWDWAPGQVAVLKHCAATPCSNSTHSRPASVMDHGEQCGTARRHRGLSEAAGTLPGPPGMLAFLALQPFVPSFVTRERVTRAFPKCLQPCWKGAVF